MSPNPMREQSQAVFQIATSGQAQVGIFDAAGRIIRRLHDGTMEAGSRSIPWDGRDDANRMLPAGTYYLRLEARSGVEPHRS